jgi:ribokinase
LTEKHVRVYGDLNLDVIYLLPTSKIRFRDVSYLARRGFYSPGGVAGNLAVALRRIGVKASVVGKVGVDPAGLMLVRDLEANNVGVGFVSYTNQEATGVMSILVSPEGSRLIIGFRGANRLNLLDDQLLDGVLRGVDSVFAYGFSADNIDGGESLKKLLGRASKEGLTTALDMGGLTRGHAALVSALRSTLNYVFINMDELGDLMGDRSLSAAEALFSILEPEALFVKMGDKGSLAITRRGKFKQDAFKIKPVDTTGSGDAFNAGVLYSLLEGFDYDRALVLGNAMGAYKALGYGARHLPRSLVELEEFIELKTGSRGLDGL